MNLGQQVILNYFLRSEIASAARFQDGDRYSIWAGPLRQQVWSEEPVSSHGMPVTKVNIRTDFLADFSGTDDQLAFLSRVMELAKICGLIRSPSDPSRIQFATSFYVSGDNFDWVSDFFSRCALSQLTTAFGYCQSFEEDLPFKLDKTAHPELGPLDFDEDFFMSLFDLYADGFFDDSRFVGKEMLEILAECQEPPCVLANGDENRVVAEYPFLGRTSMLGVSHIDNSRMLGNGLRLLLRTPAPPDNGIISCLELNERELNEHTRCHFLGCWHINGGNSVAYSVYVPNAFRTPGLAFMLTQGMATRAMWIAESVYGDDWEGGGYQKSKEHKEEFVALMLSAFRATAKPKKQGFLGRLFRKN